MNEPEVDGAGGGDGGGRGEGKFMIRNNQSGILALYSYYNGPE